MLIANKAASVAMLIYLKCARDGCGGWEAVTQWDKCRHTGREGGGREGGRRKGVSSVGRNNNSDKL